MAPESVLWRYRGNLDAVPSLESALRVMGYDGQPINGSLERAIDEARELCEVAAHGSAVIQIASANHGGKIALCGTSVDLDPSWLTPNARGAEAWGIFACTLGIQLDRELLRLSAVDPLLQMLCDAWASATIEGVADGCEAMIDEWAASVGLFGGQRISPGYGSLPLDLSASLVRALDAPKSIGMSSSPEGALSPRKSITALVPFFGDVRAARLAHRSCDDCIARVDCCYRKSGLTCYGSTVVDQDDDAMSSQEKGL